MAIKNLTTKTTKTMVTLENVYGQQSTFQLLHEDVVWGDKVWIIRNDYGHIDTLGARDDWSEISRERVKI